MAPIVAPGIVRYTLSGTNGATTWANVFDFDLEVGTPTDRPEAIEDLANIIRAAWINRIVPLVCDEQALTSVSWVDLNSLDGSTGSIGVSGGAGNDPTPPTSAQVSVLIRKNTTGGRSSRPGRWYLTGIPEAGVGVSSVETSYRTALQTAVDGFLTDTSAAVPPIAASNMALVHTRNNGTEQDPDIVFVSSTTVTSLTVSATPATQRRRLRR